VVVTGKHERPKKLPSEVDMGVKTGLLLCQDINVLDIQPSATFSKSSRIKIVGIDSTLGYVDVAEDGSFYLKVMADKPFQIQTVDKDGHINRSPCGWIWLRPNERRGCVGCHEDPEMVPANRVPLSVKKSPVVIPMHINKVVEKKVSLE
jgi:Hydrazine synthase alpha subunit middle domain